MSDAGDILDFLRTGAQPLLDVVDSHTCGQPTRVIVAGAEIAAGTEPSASRAELADGRDWVRRLAVFEPRGHRSMFAAALIAPAAAGDDYGVVFMDANGYPDMCGHATIGVATTLIECGLVALPEPNFTGEHRFGIETPAGRIALTARIVDGRCEAVAFSTPLAYYLGAVDLECGDADPVRVNIAYGGQWYAFVPVAVAGLEIVPAAIDGLIEAARGIRAQLAVSLDIVDPRSGVIPQVGNIVWTSAPHGAGAARNVPVSQADSFDRSPCGTATCARMATLVSQGALSVGEAFVNEGIMGTLYRGTAVSRVSVDGVEGIVPQVEGSAWITAHARLCVDPRDPLRSGYLIGNGAAVL